MATATTEAVGDEQLSTPRERVGWYFYDFANSAFYTTGVTVFIGPYLTAIAENAQDANGRVHPFGIPVASGSLFAYVISLSVLLQVLVLPIVGAIADRSAHKRQLLTLFAYIGSGSTIAMLWVTGDRYLLGSALLLVGNLAFGASIVVYNSFLPQLAGPDRRDAVSSNGWALGYVGGGLLLLINALAVQYGGEEHKATIARWSIVSAGIWWAAFTTIPLLRLRNRPPVAGQARGHVLIDGFRQLGRTLRSLRAYPLTLFFLAAYLVYNDGIQTVIAMAAVYADKYLHLEQSARVQSILLVQLTAFLGALLLGAIAKRYGAWKTVLGSLLFWAVTLVIAYGLPVGRALPFMLLGALIGIVLGGSQALSRSLFSQLIPKGKEGEYFGLYEISDKGTSWLGPLLFGLAYQQTGSYQIAVISLIVFFAVGFVALLAVPMRRAIAAAGNTPPHVL